jgi:hypothetical protein
MKIFLNYNSALFLISLLSMSLLYACTGSVGGPSVEAAEHFDHDWAMNDMWEQGEAEVAKYEAQREIYGKPRNFEYVYVLVKETFNEEYKVKTDDYSRDDLFDVMKINKFCRIPTENYPYHYLTSVFYRREQPATTYKLTNTSQEWCGNTSKYFLHDGRRYRFGYNSYWDGEGIGETRIEGDMMFEDQLSHALRALNFSEGLTFGQRVAESQVSSHARVPRVYDATFTVSRVNDLTLNTGYKAGDAPVWKVSVQLDADKVNHYWFSGEYPNILLKQESWDGRRLELKERYMDAYWERGNS